jgi:EAL domain-containing protein (putative c-di-GMP-specific phosphodiesterase class I)
MHQALSDASSWGSTGPGIHVDVPVDLLRESTFAEEVLALLALHEVPAERLTVEIGEDQLTAIDLVQAAVGRLHEAGVRFSVEGFGTGQSSLSYLKHLPIESVKIDRSFIATVCDGPADASIVKAVVDACHATGRTTIAVGVETPEQLRVLQALGCDAVEGALVGMPSPTELLDEVLLTGHVALPR